MAELPTGTVTFLFTDIAGSTEMIAGIGRDRYAEVLGRHHRLLRDTWARHGGVEVSTEGDAFFVAFAGAVPAVLAAADAQRALHSEPWPTDARVRVRMGLHSGEPAMGGDSYVGLDVHRAARIASAAHGGQVLISDATRALAEPSLPAALSLRDLGRHRLKGLPAPERMFQLVIDGLAADFPQVASLSVRPNNLPATMTSFIGRERQVTEASELVRATRLLTLTGPGGTGKTRLGIRVAEEVLDAFEDGCWFVALDALRDAELVASTIAASLSVQVAGDKSPLEATEAWLAGRQTLLVLDNFEQVAAAAPVVTSLIAAAPRLRVLVTSRVPLHVYGEQEYPVPPLSGPSARPAGVATAQSLSADDGARLFIERALAVRPDFRVTDDSAASIAELCARLDGLPLAIELAAARIKLMTAAEMVRRLEQSLSLLSGAARDLPERQRTLRGAIDWSYDLLDEPQQQLFARLAAFRGGFTLEAAEAVAADDDASEVLDGLASLVDNSLVRSEEAGGVTRFSMLETIREYARERLSQRPDAEAVLRRHASHFFGIAQQAGQRLLGDEHGRWLDVLEREQDNLRAAFGRARDVGLLDEALAAAGSMWRFWHLRGQFAEGRAILEGLLAETAAKPEARALALTGAGGLAYWQGEFEVMGRHYAEARKLYETLDDPVLLAQALYNESYIHIVARDFPPAVPILERAAALHRTSGNRAGLADTEFALGYLQFLVSDRAQGQARVESAIDIYRDIGATWPLADALVALGFMLAVSGEMSRALETQNQSLDMFEQMGNEMGMSMVFDAIASAAAWVGDDSRAGRLFGKADEIRQRLGGTPPLRGDLAAAYREKLRSTLGEHEWERLLGEGQALDTAAGVELGRTFSLPPDAPPLPAPDPPRSDAP